MCTFLGILFIMGFNKLPRMRGYWTQDRNLFTPAVASTMTRNDFYRLFSNTHFADNFKMPSKNSSNYKLYKHLSHTNISTVEYILSVSTALIGIYYSRKRLGRPLAMSNQKKMRIEKSISDTILKNRNF